jgi:GR25 family glycosyltransferase involved in LPS biosynthesis
MKLFITHYTPLASRKQNIIKQLNEAGIYDYEFIETYDREQLNKSDIEKFSQIKLSEISLFLKHIEIFKKELDDIVVVLEDDAILVDNFKDKLDKYLNKLKNMNWDIVFSGECCNLHIHKIDSNNIFYESNGSRGTCMYILNKGICKKINDIVLMENKIIKPIDHWFNDMKPKYNLKYYWSEPTLVLQGSEVGIFNSAIR